jgi:hypothetical protein
MEHFYQIASGHLEAVQANVENKKLLLNFCESLMVREI